MLFRLLQRVILVGYLTITAGAFIFTMSKAKLPLPKGMLRWSYGMMAPYQGDVPWNAEFRYEARTKDGAWEPVDLDSYMPYGFGERNVRKFLRVYANEGHWGLRQRFTDYSLLLLERERAKGREYVAIRAWFDQWWRSPAGYEYLHIPLLTTSDLVTYSQW